VVEVRSQRGGGAGVVWPGDGLIVTNHHVVPGDRAEIVLADGRRFAGTVERRDPGSDLAVLRVPASDLPAATIGDSTVARVGQLVIAIGNPFGVPRAVTVGIISGPSAGRHGQLEWRDGIQAEIELRPGNSGGPLLNAAGEVIAINSMVIGPRLALSIPSQTALTLIDRQGARPYLGLTVQATPLPRGLGQATGLLVGAVRDGGPAEQAGLLPGDILLAMEFQTGATAADSTRAVTLLEPGDLAWALARARTGTPVTLRLLRAGRPLQQTVTPVMSEG
jgi:serine protease Do